MRYLVLLASVASILSSRVYGEGDSDAPKVKLWKPSGKKAHDPWKKFCGSVMCYDVLEVDEDASEETIRKSYRKLAREWHPDKNPEKGARARFQKIAKAYEVLSTEGERTKYDHLMKNPQEYRKLYGDYYFKVRAPPSDVTIVIIFILLVISGIHFMILKQRKNDYNTKLLKVCVENKGPSQGGSVEILDIHRIALDRFEDVSPKGKKVKNLKTDDSFKATVQQVLAEENLLLPDPSFWDTAGFKALMLPINLIKGLMSRGGSDVNEKKKS